MEQPDPEMIADQILIMTETLNGFRNALINSGWNEERAEKAALAWWAGLITNSEKQ